MMFYLSGAPLMHLQFLVFKLHKIIGQNSIQICTGVKILNCFDFNETYLKLFVLTHIDSEKE